MAFRSGIIFITIVLGCLAIPTPPEYDDMSIFFDQEDFDDSSDARIVGGTEAANGAHPHMVALTSGTILRSFQCGGSVLSQRTVLTAAHCIAAFFSFGSLSSSLRVTVGTNRWNQGGQTLSLSGNATHQHYVSGTIKNDIGMLFTASNIVFNNLVRPISLSFDFVPGNVQARAAGWGRTSVSYFFC
ncbi:trypsin delta-like [Ostrinia furnacalis]|uniref:trypsin delta-like n=1 Tax=Ostrinia furnacalis TaxID=93504 RepID=UPI001038C33A|nr:trypsin delta-like [Ostrinia furnacalis]